MSIWEKSPSAGWQMQHNGWRGKKPGDRCPERQWHGIGLGSKACGGTLFDLDARVEELCSKLYTRRISGNDKRLGTMRTIYVTRDVDQVAIICSLLLDGKKVTTGYFCTAVRDYHSPVILHSA